MEIKITAEMSISDALEANPKAAEILRKFGMHCIGCSIASGESLGEAAQVHGIDLEKLIAALNM